MNRFEELTVFGGTSYDLVVEVSSFPSADDKNWGKVLGRFFGGMGANVAWTFTRLGGHSRLFSRVGSDAEGAACLRALSDDGVDVEGVLVDGDTFETIAMVDGSGEKAMVMLLPDDSSPPPRPSAPENLTEGDVVHIALGGNAPDIQTVEAWAKRGVRISLDVEPTMIGEDIVEWLRCSTFLFCGDVASGRMVGDVDYEERLDRLHRLGPSHVSITLGGDGSYASVEQEGKHRQKGETVRPVDTTGAGDCFAGAALYGIGQGWPLPRWVRVANRAAALTTEVLGSRHTGESLGAFIVNEPDAERRA